MVRQLALSVLAASLLVPAQAQTGRSFDSIEGLVGTSSAAYFGYITSLVPTGEPDPQTATRPVRVHFEVSERIRGAVVDGLDFVMSSSSRETDLGTACAHHIELMFTIGTQGPNRHSRTLIQLGGKTVQGQVCYFRYVAKTPEKLEPVQLSGSSYDEGRIFDLELKAVQGRDRILAKARAYQRRHPEPTASLWLQLPNPYLRQVGDPNAYGGVLLPVCAETRKTLLRVLQNPEIVLKGVAEKDRAWERRSVIAMGLRSLEPFKDKETIALVRRFAEKGDPQSQPSADTPSTGYNVKDEAVRLLEKWKVTGG